MIRLLAALAVALLSPPVTAQTLPFEGRWAMQAAWCTSTPPGQPAPVRLTRQKLDAGQFTCDFPSVLPGGVMWRVEADCTFKTEKGTERGREFFGFSVIDGLLHWSWGDRTETFRRCPD